MRKLLTALMTFYSLSCFASYSLQDLTLEEKVGQLLMVHFHGETANEEAQTLIQTVHAGSVIYYNWANGLHSPEQVRNLSSGLQKLAQENRLSIPLLIAADQEGGRVVRLNKGFTIFPANGEIAMTGRPELAEQAAFVMGQEMRSVGVNMNLAPVVDVNSNPCNPVIGNRSFGATAEIVISYASRALDGYKKAGIISCLKHFPGYGDVAIDPHGDLPIVNKTLFQLKMNEFLPFAALADKADTIMTAHIMVPSLDPKNCATLSKDILTILRDNLCFQGVIIADSLVMEGVLKNCGQSVDEAAIRAFDAGCDILILGGKQLIGAKHGFELTVADVQRIHQSLVHAIRTGRISEERLNQSVQRILDLKERITRRLSLTADLDVIGANQSRKGLL